jgi:hypothetical protein
MAVSAEEFETWIPASTAFDDALRAFASYGITAGAIALRLKNGLLRAAAEHGKQEGTEDKPKATVEIPRWHWDKWEHPGESHSFWQTGQIRLTQQRQSTYARDPVVIYFGVRFDPKGFAKLLGPKAPKPAAQLETPQSAQTKHAGGRRPAWWREPVLVEIAAQLYEGSLKPKKLADLEKAMTDWLGKKGEYPGERTVRNVAQLLWVRILEEGKNSKG